MEKILAFVMKKHYITNPSSSTLFYLNTHIHTIIYGLYLGSIIGQIPPKNVKYQELKAISNHAGSPLCREEEIL